MKRSNVYEYNNFLTYIPYVIQYNRSRLMSRIVE